MELHYLQIAALAVSYPPKKKKYPGNSRDQVGLMPLKMVCIIDWVFLLLIHSLKFFVLSKRVVLNYVLLIFHLYNSLNPLFLMMSLVNWRDLILLKLGSFLANSLLT